MMSTMEVLGSRAHGLETHKELQYWEISLGNDCIIIDLNVRK